MLAFVFCLLASLMAVGDEGQDTTPPKSGIRDDLILTLLPESRIVAPYQPLRFALVLKNLSEEALYPDQTPNFQRYFLKIVSPTDQKVISSSWLFRAKSNLRPRLLPLETHVRHIMHEGPSPYADGERYEDEQWPLLSPGKYRLQLSIGDSPKAVPAIESNIVEIEVRVPSDSEQEIGAFLRLYLKDVLEAQSVRHGNRENLYQLQSLLKKYPKSSLSDELRYYLWWESGSSQPYSEKVALIAAISPHKTYLRKPLVAMAQTGARDHEDREMLSKVLLELVERPPTIYSTDEQERLQRAVLALQRRISNP